MTRDAGSRTVANFFVRAQAFYIDYIFNVRGKNSMVAIIFDVRNTPSIEKGLQE